MIDKANIQSVYGLAAMQKSMLLSHALDTSSDAYVEQFDFALVGTVDVEAMRRALNGLSQYYAVLRSVFSFRNTDDPYQLVLRRWEPKLTVLDLQNEPFPAASLAFAKNADKQLGFDLSRDVLFRAMLVQLAERDWHLVLSFHHIILDGWSLGPLFATLVEYYERAIDGGEIKADSEQKGYSEYVRWCEAQDPHHARQYWAEVLDGYEKPAVLPTTHTDDYASAVRRFSLPVPLYAALRAVSQEKRVTLSALFHAAWGVLLQKYNYADDVVFGSVVSGRAIPLDGVDRMVGLFVNTQPLRVKTTDGGTFIELAQGVQESFRCGNDVEYFPLFEIQNDTMLKSSLLNHVVAFENYPLAEQLQNAGGSGGGLLFQGVEYVERTSYDLTVTVNPGQSLDVTLTYNEKAFSPELIEAIEKGMIAVLQAATQHPDVCVHDIAISVVPPTSEDAVGQLPELPQVSVVDLFDAAVDRSPDAVALVWHGSELTYADLDRWSDAIAWQLHERGVLPGSGVALLFDRCPELIVGMLAVLKAGCHYIPIEVKEATARIEFLLADADALCLLTVVDLANRVPADAPVLLIERVMQQPDPFPRGLAKPDGYAYMMYTSGSTGRPKGCYITHRNIVRLFCDQTFYDFGAAETIMLTSSPAFDVCTFEVWGSLLFGARLVLPDEVDILDVSRLGKLLREQAVRSLWLTSPLFNRLCDIQPGVFASLHHLLIGGSALSPKHVAKVLASSPWLRVTNGYGPTENTTFSTTHAIEPQDLTRDRIPIGTPVSHSTTYVLDRGLNPLPVGAVGELCVGGDGVAAGYRKRQELTAERFVTLPWLGGERVYRTGDLVALLPDGKLDYLGRVDDQVKIRGFRVEIGEVELSLQTISGVLDGAVAVVERDGEKRLAAFYVTAEGLQSEDIRLALGKQLPSYMIPTTISPVGSLPLNKSGKVDRRALIELYADQPSFVVAQDLRQQMGTTERTLTEIVEDVLGERIADVHGNFFDIGVNSLSLLSINNRLRKAGWDVPLKTLFEYTSIVALAEHLDRGGSSGTDISDITAEEEAEDSVLRTSQLFLQISEEEAPYV